MLLKPEKKIIEIKKDNFSKSYTFYSASVRPKYSEAFQKENSKKISLLIYNLLTLCLR